MDTKLSYPEIIKKALSDYVKFFARGGVTSMQTLFDDTQKSYLVLNLGWRGDKYIHNTAIHIDIINGKIWMQNDHTEDGIATDLLEAGVPRENIVLGFRHPKVRPYTDFATG